MLWQWQFKIPVAILAVIALLMFDRQFFREPSIANKYPCPLVNLPSFEPSLHPETNRTNERRYQLPDGTFVSQVEALEPGHADLLVLTLIKDASSYGHDKDQPTRAFSDYLQLLMHSNLDLKRVSLGIATESQEEHENIKVSIQNMTAQYGYFPRFTLLLNNAYFSEVDRNNRHHLIPEVQTARRGHIAQFRNMLTFHSLQSESRVLWLDADIDYLSPNVIQTMLAHQASDHTAGIITARCQEGPTYDYDKNAWAGERFQEGDSRTGTRRLVSELIKGTGSNDLIPLNSVGGTVLLIRSALISKGLLFPTTPIIGAEWSKAGWDGIETEGLCALARDLGDELDGSGCFVLGGDHHVRHTNY